MMQYMSSTLSEIVTNLGLRFKYPKLLPNPFA